MKLLSDFCLLLGIAMMLIAYFITGDGMYWVAFGGLGAILFSLLAEYIEKAPSTANTGSAKRRTIVKHIINHSEVNVK